VVGYKEQGQGPGGHRHPYKPDTLRTRVIKLHGEDGELVFLAKALQDPQQARAARVSGYYLVIKERDAHV
jgi:hypothetical protein